MRSRLSFASMRNSGCLNSQACNFDQSLGPRANCRGATYARAIPWAAIVWPPHFVKVVLVQLADEAGEVAVFEVFREHASREFLALFRNPVRHGATKTDDCDWES